MYLMTTLWAIEWFSDDANTWLSGPFFLTEEAANAAKAAIDRKRQRRKTLSDVYNSLYKDSAIPKPELLAVPEKFSKKYGHGPRTKEEQKEATEINSVIRGIYEHNHTLLIGYGAKVHDSVLSQMKATLMPEYTEEEIRKAHKMYYESKCRVQPSGRLFESVTEYLNSNNAP